MIKEWDQYHQYFYTPTDINNIKPGDVIYRIKIKMMDYIEETYRVLEIDENGLHSRAIICNMFDGPVEKVALGILPRFYITYEQIVEHNVNLARDGFPWDRPYNLIVKGDQLEFPEYYI